MVVGQGPSVYLTDSILAAHTEDSSNRTFTSVSALVRRLRKLPPSYTASISFLANSIAKAHCCPLDRANQLTNKASLKKCPVTYDESLSTHFPPSVRRRTSFQNIQLVDVMSAHSTVEAHKNVSSVH